MVSKNCPCKSRVCKCNVDGTGGLTWTGNGSDRLPYIPTWALPGLVGVDTDQADITITGTGVSGDPYVLSIVTLGGSVQSTIYANDDTWDKPNGGAVAQVVVIGGGGGGGGVAPDADAGGSGGAGGAMSVNVFLLDDLPDEVDIEVGKGGRGGKPIAGSTNAENGGDSWFGPYLGALGGRGGQSQANPSQTQYVTPGGTPPEGGPGGAGAIRDGAGVVEATEHTTYLSPTGGGMGSGTTVGGSGVGTSAGVLWMKNGWAGQGGDGGDTAIVGPSSWPGEDGNLYGGGGGGGASDSTDSWGGGDGAPGVVVVTVW